MEESFNLIIHDFLDEYGNFSSNQEFNNEDLIKIYSSLNPENAEIHNIKNILPELLYDIPDVYILVVRNIFLNISNEIVPVFQNCNFSLSNPVFSNSTTIRPLYDLNLILQRIFKSYIFIEASKVNKTLPFKNKKIGLGIGESFSLKFKWCHGAIVISDKYEIKINNGDLYIISEMASEMIKEKVTKIFIKTEISC